MTGGGDNKQKILCVGIQSMKQKLRQYDRRQPRPDRKCICSHHSTALNLGWLLQTPGQSCLHRRNKTAKPACTGTSELHLER